ncbi:hypothetical protein ACT79_23785 [Burkholderia pseudomallei]|nr:hypothetical protein ACT79_23785 [Burkholderia pseudomallei]
MIRSRSSNATSAFASRRASSSTKRSRAPAQSGDQISQCAASKPSAAICVERLVRSTPNCALCHAISPSTERCSTTTPLGTPVVPEVKIT